MRAADAPEEVAALQERVRQAQVSADARGCSAELEDFSTIVAQQSQAVMCRGLSPLASLVLSDNVLMSTYYNQVSGNARIPANNGVDVARGPCDAIINPHDVYREIQQAALSLNGLGAPGYGDYALTFDNEAIQNRATVFEENPMIFVERLGVTPAKPAPLGYRATWGRRAELAMAKLQPKITKGMSSDDFPSVLLAPADNPKESDFIEVHIYGPIPTRAISRVIAKSPSNKGDRAIWARIKKRLSEDGAEVRET